MFTIMPDGFTEQCMPWQSRGADPDVLTENYDPYLDPGTKTPREVAIDDEETQDALAALEAKYAGVAKVRVPHTDIGCWWTLYDYGQEAISRWAASYLHPYPGVQHLELGSTM